MELFKLLLDHVLQVTIEACRSGEKTPRNPSAQRRVSANAALVATATPARHDELTASHAAVVVHTSPSTFSPLISPLTVHHSQSSRPSHSDLASVFVFAIAQSCPSVARATAAERTTKSCFSIFWRLSVGVIGQSQTF